MYCRKYGPIRRPALGYYWNCLLHTTSPCRNHYKVLGVKPDADIREIKENFYELSKKFHPDLNKDEKSLLKFKEIAEAYEILSNQELRKQYDLQNRVTSPAPAPGVARHARRPGMRGHFRNDQFVDEDRPPEMREIRYDLSQERMERVWVDTILRLCE
jgi:curved DNA-binding protein CbpA